MSPILFCLLNPLPLLSMHWSWCGCAQLESVPTTDSEIESFVSASQLNCVLVSRGVVCFCRASLHEKGQKEQAKDCPTQPFVTHYLWVFQNRWVQQKPRIYSWYKDARLHPLCQMASEMSWSRTNSGRKLLYEKQFMRKYIKRSWKSSEDYVIIEDKTKNENILLARKSLAQQKLSGCLFLPLCWESGGINQCQTWS